MKKYFILYLMCLCLANPAGAQSFFFRKKKPSATRSTTMPRTCGTVEYNRQLEMSSPENRAGRQAALKRISERLMRADDVKNQQGLVTIPVVVHVVYANTSENISDADIQSQIDVLNRDFRKLNSDIGLAPAPFLQVSADMEIEFCLASVDPNGNPTSGITRTSTTHAPFYLENDVKFTANGGHDVWNPSRYLNLWVCGLSSGLLGYAQFPGLDPSTDGVVIDSDCFGDLSALEPYNKGRTATHEIGHYFDLRHIWGDESSCSADDGVDDTPQQKGQNLGCPVFPNTTGSGANCSGNYPGSMFMNYMDYTNDACMYLFTNGQKAVLRATLDGTRASLKTAASCSSTLTCDTLFNVTSSDAPQALMISGSTTSWGYVAGHNSFGDLGKAERVTPASVSGKKIKGLLIYFSTMTNSNDTFVVSTYQDNNGVPGTKLQTMRVAYSSFAADVQNDLVSTFTFPLPVNALSTFFAGVEYSYGSGDTLAIYTNMQNASANTGFEKTSGNIWQPYNTPTSQGGWGFSLSHYLAAVLCDELTGEESIVAAGNEVSVFPNPSSGKLFVGLPEKESRALANFYDMSGTPVESFALSRGLQTLDISALPPGYYLLQIRSGTLCVNKKILLVR